MLFPFERAEQFAIGFEHGTCFHLSTCDEFPVNLHNIHSTQFDEFTLGKAFSISIPYAPDVRQLYEGSRAYGRIIWLELLSFENEWVDE
jgi:hypothetical protein